MVPNFLGRENRKSGIGQPIDASVDRNGDINYIEWGCMYRTVHITFRVYLFSSNRKFELFFIWVNVWR